MMRLCHAVGQVVHGKSEVIRLAVVALAARGHLLLEDIPGVGKTTLARALAKATGGTFRRIQFTSDLLPSDVIGVSVWNEETRLFEFKQGPLFANVVLADEVNRAAPRTQSSLLEAMSEGRVSVDHVTYTLEQPFLVMATQNPLEHFGTYPLPESQMDRFLLRLRLGYPSRMDERRVVMRGSQYDPIEDLTPAATPQDVTQMQDTVCLVRVEESLLEYAERLVAETRRSALLQLGVSPRGFQSWYRAAQARALSENRDFCVPDDFRDLAVSALAHRVVLPGGSQAGYGDALSNGRAEAERILSGIIDRVPVP
jgi:MoxR-like ATPase